VNWTDIKHFQPSEFDSPDEPGSGFAHFSLIFALKLDEMREEAGFPFIVDSGYRTVAHNASLEGAVDGSAHCSGLAVDLACRTSGQRMRLVELALKHDIRRIGIGKTFVHLDIDSTKPKNVIWLY
jgi:uncharacterized protein YcbK (DUF882 family)